MIILSRVQRRRIISQQANKLNDMSKEDSSALPSCRKGKDWAKGHSFLASSLLSDGAELELTLLMCDLSSSMELDRSSIQEFEDIPSQLRQWI